jgi:hypothetical protein
MQIILALIIFSVMTLQVPQVRGADSGNADNGTTDNVNADNGQTLLFEKSFPTESGERLKFNGYSGNVKINGWCRNMVKIRIFGSPEAVKYLNFKISSDEMGINIGVKTKNGYVNVKNLILRYEISVPRNYDVKVTDGKKPEHMKLR